MKERDLHFPSTKYLHKLDVEEKAEKHVHALQKPIERKHTSQTTSNINWNWGGFVPLLLPADTGRILIQPRSTVLWPVRCGGVIPRQMWRNSDWS